MKRSVSTLVVLIVVLAAACNDRTDPTGSARATVEGGSSQDGVEAEIRRLEQMEVQAVLTIFRQTKFENRP